MRILLVAGGHLPIPPPSWGGVENVVWQQHNYLKSAGHDVQILNKTKKTVSGFLARPWQYDLIHLHLDSGAKAWNKLRRLFRFKLAVTTHYGYAAFPDRWQTDYQATFAHLLKVPHHIALSPEIKDTVLRAGFSGQVLVLPNGIKCADMRFDPAPAPKQALVLGRIQERKKQRLLSQALAGRLVTCDLIGPSDEPDFLGNNSNVRFLGPWDRTRVLSSLTQYACMILISDGEAHAGVLLEALAAGLSIVVSPEAAHNLDTDQPWVFVVNRDRPGQITRAVEQAVAENWRHRAAIRRYCEETFDWKVIGPRYVNIIEQIVAGRQGRSKAAATSPTASADVG